ncbi:hypothetical protein Cp87MAT_0413 [Corynebacterium pseudotuberculosis]|nr:hypothetical protein Cp87MAT_0413 [Corynebacterium pseudotuberculosis]
MDETCKNKTANTSDVRPLISAGVPQTWKKLGAMRHIKN